MCNRENVKKGVHYLCRHLKAQQPCSRFFWFFFLEIGNLLNDLGPLYNMEHCSSFCAVTRVWPSKHTKLSPCISAKIHS